MIPFLTPQQITTKYFMTMTDTLTKLISVTPDAEKHMSLLCPCEQSKQPGKRKVLWSAEVLCEAPALEYL